MANDLSVLNIEKVSPIINFYKGKSIFLTGGTGFLGTVVISKLLLTCKDLKNIYILIKPKRNNSIKERLEKLMNSNVFDKIRESNPETLKKVIPIYGNLLEDNLGISEDDIRTLRNEVSIVFHSAANVNFDVPLAEALNTNTRATEKMVYFCKGIKLLQAFVYVSTAYSNCNRVLIDEKVYKTMNSLDSVQYIVSQKGSSQFSRNILEGRPNTYTYTKALAENTIVDKIDALPAVIVRPSIITAAETDPFPGWVNSWNGMNNVAARQGKGLLRCWKTNVDAVIDIIPVDYVANLMIAAAWDVHKRRNFPKKEVKVFNCCSGTRNPVLIGDFLYKNIKYSRKHLKQDGIIRPYLLTTKNVILFWIIFFFIQTIPMYLYHIIECVRGSKRGMSMIEIHRKLYEMVIVLGFFAINQFAFIDSNVKDLYNAMDENDQKTFNFNVENIKWERYCENMVLGFKKYLLKETTVEKNSS